MKWITTPLLVLVFLATASAVPAPDRAKEKLEAMKKKLPEVVNKWVKDVNWFHAPAEVKLVRQIGPTRAKVTMRLPPYVNRQGQVLSSEEMLTVYLRYHDGTWTSTRGHATGDQNASRERAVTKLMLALDQLGEK